MIRLIACSADNGEVGEYTETSIYNPWEERYVTAAIRILRISNEQEYLRFCQDHGLPIRNAALTDTPYYYEIEILD